MRRFRVGFKAKLFKQFKLDGIININPHFDPFYRDIYEFFLTWAPDDHFSVSAGKEEVEPTLEQTTSSREILTFERSLLVNTVFPGELTGIWVKDKQNSLDYKLALYANDYQREFSQFEYGHDDGEQDAGVIVTAKVGYNIGKNLGVEKLRLGADYMWNSQPNYPVPGVKLGNNRFVNRRSPRFDHTFALNADFANGPYALTAEAIFANDDEATHTSVYGFQIMPTVFLAKSQQLITRFQIAHSNGDNGLALPSRYDALAFDTGDKRGEDYYAPYAGLNYYLCGHKLKVMTGIEYADMDGGDDGDYSGWTYLLGARMYF